MCFLFTVEVWFVGEKLGMIKFSQIKFSLVVVHKQYPKLCVAVVVNCNGVLELNSKYTLESVMKVT